MNKKTLVSWAVRLGSLSLVAGVATGLVVEGDTSNTTVQKAQAAVLQNTQDNTNTQVTTDNNQTTTDNNQTTIDNNGETSSLTQPSFDQPRTRTSGS